VFRSIARGFAERGYAVMIPHYFERTGHIAGEAFRASEVTSFVEAVADGGDFGAASGIVDPDRIGMVGYSMGAHIAFFRAARDRRIKAVVSVAGRLPVESRSKFPPVLILQGSNDRSNPVSRVKAFEEVLKAQGVPHASRVYRGMGHNFDVDRWDDAAVRAAAFLDKHLRGNSTGARSKRSRAQRGRAAARPGATEKKARTDKDDGAPIPERPHAAGEGRGPGPADPAKPGESGGPPETGSGAHPGASAASSRVF
jgi:dienelactone hydrolase